MSENKYDYLIKQWNEFQHDIKVDEKVKKEIDDIFREYFFKIKNNELKLREYTSRIEKNDKYFCTFIENMSSAIYGSASASTATYFGIKLNKDLKTYYISNKILENRNKHIENASEEQATTYFPIIVKNLQALIKNEINEENKKDIFNCVENDNKITSRVMLRKIVAMANPGNFLYAYSDESIRTIYSFFIGESKGKMNIEMNFDVTKEIKKFFLNNEKEDETLYMIKLSRFIWSIFGAAITLEAKNIILHGAPGTGKTYSIKNTIKNIILKEGGSLDNQLVFSQFHPSYSYEDFIDGIKPNGIDKNSGQLKFELKNGNFKGLCRKATLNLKEARIKNKSPHTFYFIADEINRAELSRVFGELLISLEEGYRIDFDSKGNLLNEENLITLQNATLDERPVYELNGKSYFGVPSNLYFIGTMNDIDRSVDSFDMALRRRFYWKEIRCNYDYIESVCSDGNGLILKQICKDLNRFITGFKEEKSNGKLEKVTSKIKGKEPLRLGTSFELGHAYFKDLDKVTSQSLNKLWESKIEPLLYEYLRAEYSQDEIYTKLMEAKEIFSLPNSETND